MLRLEQIVEAKFDATVVTLIDEDKAPLKGVDGKSYLIMLLNLRPGLFHFRAPVYIIKNEDAVLVCSIQTHFEVFKCCLFLMIAVKKNEVI